MTIALRSSKTVIYTFTLGNNIYVSNGAPLEAYTYYCDRDDDRGWWIGKRNTALTSERTPHNEFSTLENAFDYLKTCSKDPRHKSGFVMDFSTHTLYFENELVLRYLEARQDHASFFTRRIVIRT